jgi:hypothetical protein
MDKSKVLFPILTSVIAGLLVAGLAFAWTNPTANPPGGGGALYYSAGNVGIGTTGPLEQLHVYEAGGGASWRGRAVFGGQYNTVVAGEYQNNAILGAHNAGLTTWSPLYLNWEPVGGGGGNVLMKGNVGIGTTAPEAKLEVKGGNIKIQTGVVGQGRSLIISDNIAGSGHIGHITAGGTVNGMEVITDSTGDLYLGASGATRAVTIKPTTGNVGIGTTGPVTKLQINSAVGTEDRVVRLVHNSAGNTAVRDRVGNLEFVGYPASDSLVYAKIAWHHNAYFNYGTDLSFWTTQVSDNTLRERVRITEAGNVGIGTTNPGAKLEVVGGPIKATGGLIIETRTSDPANPVTGQIWLRVDL